METPTHLGEHCNCIAYEMTTAQYTRVCCKCMVQLLTRAFQGGLFHGSLPPEIESAVASSPS